MTLKSVVLPAPFGPLTPTIRPCGTSQESPDRAVSPPKDLVTSLNCSRGLFMPRAFGTSSAQADLDRECPGAGPAARRSEERRTQRAASRQTREAVPAIESTAPLRPASPLQSSIRQE